ncbi:MAG: MFS transporter [Gemmatimonadetes bacterium]|nr:MFS transporter [Gemmatimonadota bacterium]
MGGRRSGPIPPSAAGGGAEGGRVPPVTAGVAAGQGGVPPVTARGGVVRGSGPPVQLGLRENLPQFSLLVLINAFVGAMVGLERTVLPLIAERDFGLTSSAAVLSFLVSFGITKAFANLVAGGLADRLGRRRVLLWGWFAGIPVPFLIMAAPSWSWIVAANVLLGVNQGLCWSTTVIMKIDLAGPKQRGLAMGLNEFAGYLAVSAAALTTGFLGASLGLRSALFYPGVALVVLGLLSTLLLVRDTSEHARLEAAEGGRRQLAAAAEPGPVSFLSVFTLTSWKNRSLFAASQAGLVNNLNDGVIWGLLPLTLATSGLTVQRIAIVAATYPAVWGLCQLATGALSDRWGRKWLITAGMLVQAVGIGLFVLGQAFGTWISASVLLGIGTAMVYPTLLAAVSDVAQPEWRATAVGVYRLWRDGGYAVGGLAVGVLADLLGRSSALAAVAALTAASGAVVALTMRETLGERTPSPVIAKSWT